MRVCILENDRLSEGLAPAGMRVADFHVDLLRRNGADGWRFDVFHTPAGEYPASFAAYDAVLLTGSGADSFSDVPWVVELRRRVTELLAARQKVVGICFGHQVLGLCLGASVGRAPNGWVIGRQTYAWHGGGRERIGLLATHRDQLKELPAAACLLASSPACPIAGFMVGEHIFSLQPHPELGAAILRALIERRRERLGDDHAEAALRSLQAPHEGDVIGRALVRFMAGGLARKEGLAALA
jgi:GMP synthase-like glutamine amidotransferase